MQNSRVHQPSAEDWQSRLAGRAAVLGKSFFKTMCYKDAGIYPGDFFGARMKMVALSFSLGSAANLQ
ncbi:MAG TPA: hypothetical protein VHC39_06740 [Rhizomicrobium sp.]|nr:hypothetical protein [Rhizomicrobium sp.]